ncbi:MAG: glycosyltransferase family 4 protein [Chloroflexi bacterium]|nr:glycosyltransferase family 4 protein [Chloroflexota bacterium]
MGIKGLPARGGAERVVEALVARMPGLGISPTVYCDRRYTPCGFSLPGVELIRLPALQGKHLRSTTLTLLAAFHAVGRGRYDLVHLHNVEASFVLPILRTRFSVVATSHGPAYRRAKWGPWAQQLIHAMDVPFVKGSNVVTCVSAKDGRDLAARFGRPVTYIPNGVDGEPIIDLEQARVLLQRHNLSPKRYIVFVAGRVEPTKGAHVAIQAANRLEHETSLLVVGDHTQVPAYSRQLQEMAGPNTHFQPLIRDPGVLFGVMKEALCLVFPSSVEAMSMVLLEAAALGVPILCSDIEENREVMRDDAMYFETGNTHSLADKLQWVLDHEDQACFLSWRAQKRMKTDFAWEKVARRYAGIYRDLKTKHD